MRPLPLLRRAVAVGALTALTAACGSSSVSAPDGGDRLSPYAAVQAAAEATESQESFRFEITSRTEAGGESFEVSGDGAYDTASRSGTASFVLPGGQTLEQVFLGDRLLMSAPGTAGYYEFDLEELTGTQFGAAEPSGSLELLREISDDVTEVGEDTVRGDATTRYRGTLDPRKAMEQAGAGAGLEGLGISVEDLEPAPFEIWIDDEQRLRRMTFTFTLPGGDATGGHDVATSMTMELFDFGVEVSVEEPPADQVQDGSALLEGLRGQGAAG